MNRIILLEDEISVARSFSRLLEQNDYEVINASNYKEFQAVFEDFDPDLILLDIELKNSEKNGLQIFEEYRIRDDFHAKVVVLSAKASLSQVADAMKMGAVNFIEKSPYFKKDKFLADIHQAVQLSLSQREIDKLKMTSIDSAFMGQSDVMKRIKRKILKFAKTDMNILITGETGTGKGVVAELIHNHSKRSKKPLKVVDVKSISDSLIESELFGHSKGAFTGADREKKGYFENANNGTLFMDEIANLSWDQQAKILKVIEEKKVSILGTGGKNLDIDVRIISASNQDLAALSAEDKFRNDLYFRLNVGNIYIPPLREREGDILYLMYKFLVDSTRENFNSLDIDLEAMAHDLTSYTWPGNVRELKNFCTYLSMLYDRIDNQIIKKEFNQHREKNHKLAKVLSHKIHDQESDKLILQTDYKTATEMFAQKYINFHLKVNGGNVTKTAEAIGVDRTTIYNKLKKPD